MVGQSCSLLLVFMLYVMMHGSRQTAEIVQRPSTPNMCRKLCQVSGDPTDHFNFIKEDLSCRSFLTNVSISKENHAKRKSPRVPANDQPAKNTKRLSLMTRQPITDNQGYKRIQAGEDVICVKRFDKKRTWEQASRICRSENGALVIIDTKEKSNQIKERLSRSSDKWKSFYMWIGLRDFDDKDVFEWIDRTKCTFDDWDEGEPNNVISGPKGTTIQENCVALVHNLFSGLHWNDLHCGRKNGFICEKKFVKN